MADQAYRPDGIWTHLRRLCVVQNAVCREAWGEDGRLALGFEAPHLDVRGYMDFVLDECIKGLRARPDVWRELKGLSLKCQLSSYRANNSLDRLAVQLRALLAEGCALQDVHVGLHDKSSGASAGSGFAVGDDDLARIAMDLNVARGPNLRRLTLQLPPGVIWDGTGCGGGFLGVSWAACVHLMSQFDWLRICDAADCRG